MRPVLPDEFGIVYAHRSDEVKLPCCVKHNLAATNVTWIWFSTKSVGVIAVYSNGQIIGSRLGRFSLYNRAMGDYSLKMLDMRRDDNGHYRCFNHDQQLRKYHILVMGYGDLTSSS